MTTPKRRRARRLRVRLRAHWRGWCEVFAFFTSGLRAIVRFGLGRWPETRNRDTLQPRASGVNDERA